MILLKTGWRRMLTGRRGIMMVDVHGADGSSPLGGNGLGSRVLFG
jgi:hypothetical protein